ncbi:fructose-1,6-bisphosphatase [Gallalistipes aquisgranensis]|uniref:fructose-1,6-bisphosphatase n=1 Tax=Gallalistipes aquisgranensis TaxID=2779358 RepID=UPI001CF905B6|nr:fructose-1,6-bisphosphatase [Gallalistipes aquisgranensis]MBE5032761.1 fructose-1,6-bisphosphatase [Gallalistipes aquisgranensis]
MSKSTLTTESVQKELKYLQLLSRSFPAVSDATTEIINLEAILNLPKGTEHFLTDLHGEDEAFRHVLKNASGVVRRKVEDLFAHTLRESERRDLCTLIYYPEQKLELVKARESNMEDWYRITLHQLIRVCQNVSSKYTRSKVRKALPPEYSYIIQELLHESQAEPNKFDYINGIIGAIVSTGRADHFITAMSHLIQRLTIDMLHIVGDIYDRGPGAHIIMDTLCRYHNFDIQWGNHDILWMGAAAGNTASIANAVRIALRYASLATLEDGYGINLLPLATFAMEQYGDDPCTVFRPKSGGDASPDEKTVRLIAQMHKAVTVVQFKLEGQLIARRPEFGMSDRLLLDKVDFGRGVLRIDGREIPLRDTRFPTVDPADPYRLTPEEEELVEKLRHSFLSSEKLRLHMRCLYAHGSLYLVRNSNLLFHASIPLNEDGSFREVTLLGKRYAGRRLLDRIDSLVRTAYFGSGNGRERQFALDYMWYLWCGADSPLFDKSKMATFERYFTADKEAQREIKGHYYTLRDEEAVCDRIFAEFGLDGTRSHIINGHVPVKTLRGEKPMKAGGRVLVIDGGFSKAYQPETGIAGYTLIYNSHGLQLVQHEPFESAARAIEEGLDIRSALLVLEFTERRMMVRDTDIGRELEKQIEDLNKLLVAYRSGLIKERT